MRWAVAGLLACVMGAGTAGAALPTGAPAPDFSTAASLAGREFTFRLADALKRGPVVLYFYPAAFTPGCTIEAHDFAAATPDFAALHATVIGVSMDAIGTLDRFSVSECRDKFPVASDQGGAISRSYDAVLTGRPGYANRTSYVIAPGGTVVYAYSAMNPAGHVANTIGAVRAWEAAHPAR